MSADSLVLPSRGIQPRATWGYGGTAGGQFLEPPAAGVEEYWPANSPQPTGADSLQSPALSQPAWTKPSFVSCMTWQTLPQAWWMPRLVLGLLY